MCAKTRFVRFSNTPNLVIHFHMLCRFLFSFRTQNGLNTFHRIDIETRAVLQSC